MPEKGEVQKSAAPALPSVMPVSNTDYIGAFIYQNKTLKKILTPVGYIEPGTDSDTYYFYRSDYQGNIRMVIDGEGQILEQNNYYPFGMLFGTCVGESNKQPYKFGGKEYITAKGYNIYDFGARGLNPATGLWGTPDPLLEKYFSTSPYAYCRNNPVLRIDPDGKADWEMVGRGALNTTARVFSLLTGGAVASTGAGAAVGAFLVIEGMGMTAFGASQVAIGLAADPTKENKKMASELPQSITDIGGIVADKAVGNQNGEIRSAVQISTMIIGAGLSMKLPTNLVNPTKQIISIGSSATTATQFSLWIHDNIKLVTSDKDELPSPAIQITNPELDSEDITK